MGWLELFFFFFPEPICVCIGSEPTQPQAFREPSGGSQDVVLQLKSQRSKSRVFSTRQMYTYQAHFKWATQVVFVQPKLAGDHGGPPSVLGGDGRPYMNARVCVCAQILREPLPSCSRASRFLFCGFTQNEPSRGASCSGSRNWLFGVPSYGGAGVWALGARLWSQARLRSAEFLRTPHAIRRRAKR